MPRAAVNSSRPSALLGRLLSQGKAFCRAFSRSCTALQARLLLGRSLGVTDPRHACESLQQGSQLGHGCDADFVR